jgi:hypothetical protein
MQFIVVETVLVVTIPGGCKGGLNGVGAISVHSTFVQSVSDRQRTLGIGVWKRIRP